MPLGMPLSMPLVCHWYATGMPLGLAAQCLLPGLPGCSLASLGAPWLLLGCALAASWLLLGCSLAAPPATTSRICDGRSVRSLAPGCPASAG